MERIVTCAAGLEIKLESSLPKHTQSQVWDIVAVNGTVLKRRVSLGGGPIQKKVSTVRNCGFCHRDGTVHNTPETCRLASGDTHSNLGFHLYEQESTEAPGLD
jgi:hypothetical protein